MDDPADAEIAAADNARANAWSDTRAVVIENVRFGVPPL